MSKYFSNDKWNTQKMTHVIWGYWRSIQMTWRKTLVGRMLGHLDGCITLCLVYIVDGSWDFKFWFEYKYWPWQIFWILKDKKFTLYGIGLWWSVNFLAASAFFVLEILCFLLKYFMDKDLCREHVHIINILSFSSKTRMSVFPWEWSIQTILK